jgi:NHS family xanthosine MFS transporter
MMTNGFGAFFGTIASSKIIEKYYLLPNGQTDWSGAWTLFAIYSLVVAVLFAVLFKQKHQEVDVSKISH